MKTVKFYTLGCKVNQYDTQSIREQFLRAGFQELENSHPADIYVINTCTVTQRADAESLNLICRAKRQNPKAKIIVTGCLAEKGTQLLSAVKGADFIVSKRFFPERPISGFSGHTRAFLKVQDGCDNFCSYCKVPLARGRSRSRQVKEILKEAKSLVENGYKEIVLCGICLGAFGKDLPQQTGLVELLEALEKIEGLARIRLSSIEASDVSDKLIHKIAKSAKLCRHLHIPMQSGDDEILKKMNRKLNSRDYLRLIDKLKRSVPGIGITTDVMVGFPGETDKHFQNTLKLIMEITPLKVHIFPYSPREGTAAHKLTDRVSPAIIRERIRLLKGVADVCALDYKNSFSGRELDVLIEGRCKQNKGYWEGFSGNYIKVMLSSNRNLKNKIIRKRFP